MIISTKFQLSIFKNVGGEWGDGRKDRRMSHRTANPLASLGRDNYKYLMWMIKKNSQLQLREMSFWEIIVNSVFTIFQIPLFLQSNLCISFKILIRLTNIY